MGSRVNYVVVSDGAHTVYAQGGGAGYGIDYFFAPGPEVVLRWLANAGFYATGHWFEDVICEGGVLIDVDRQVLVLFNTGFNQVPYRAAMLEAYAATWPGWEIRWAYDGIGDLMAYVGLDPADAHDEHELTRSDRNGFDDDDVLRSVVTLRGAGGHTAVYGLNLDLAWRRWQMGPELVDWIVAGPELPGNVAAHKLASGLHLDLATQRAGLWTVEPLRGLRERWAELWPGWTLDFWGDDLRRQPIPRPGWADDLIAPDVISRCRHDLAERVRRYWPVRATWLAAGTDVDWLYEQNVAGCRSLFDADVTVAELERVAELLQRG